MDWVQWLITTLLAVTSLMLQAIETFKDKQSGTFKGKQKKKAKQR